MADEMEIWVVASVLGLHLPSETEAEPDPYGDFDPIKARVEAQKKGLPPPTAPPPTSRRGAGGVRTLRPTAAGKERGA